jgi:hypothetical protein
MGPPRQLCRWLRSDHAGDTKIGESTRRKMNGNELYPEHEKDARLMRVRALGAAVHCVARVARVPALANRVPASSKRFFRGHF